MMNMTANRIRFTAMIGYDQGINTKQSRLFLAAIYKELSRLYGGLTVNQGLGYWLDDADQFKESYNGALASEDSVQILLTVERDQALQAYQHIQGIISAAIDMYDIDADWIHVEAEPTMALHFSAKEFLEKNIARAAEQAA